MGSLIYHHSNILMDLDRDIIHVIEYLWKAAFVFYSQT
ncbi:hypothetical protein RintRC_0649 [Richelia intracellularis]|nr:hypothetical protein RintRC_0649 [Richelia intracellularis]